MSEGVPTGLVQRILTLVHGASMAGHFGQAKQTRNLNQKLDEMAMVSPRFQTAYQNLPHMSDIKTSRNQKTDFPDHNTPISPYSTHPRSWNAQHLPASTEKRIPHNSSTEQRLGQRRIYVNCIPLTSYKELKARLFSLHFMLTMIVNITYIAQKYIELLIEADYYNSSTEKCKMRRLQIVKVDPTKPLDPSFPHERYQETEQLFTQRVAKTMATMGVVRNLKIIIANKNVGLIDRTSL